MTAASAASQDSTQEDRAALYEQRLAYRKAVSALRTGRSTEFRRQAVKLRNYALHPYLVHCR